MTDRKLRHILCVDDERDILEVTRLCLEMVGGFEVTTSNSALDALAKMSNRSPDLIMVDVMMPDIDGPGWATGAGGRRLRPCKRAPGSRV